MRIVDYWLSGSSKTLLTPILIPNIPYEVLNLVFLKFTSARHMKMGVVDFRTPPHGVELGTFFGNQSP